MVTQRLRQLICRYVRPVARPITRPRRPLPALPESLREPLKDYPEHLERLQLALHGVVIAPASRLTRLEMALWALEDRVGRFVAEAQLELEVARSSGDAERLECAVQDEAVMRGLPGRDEWLKDPAFPTSFMTP